MLQQLIDDRCYGSRRANCLKRVVTSRQLSGLELSSEIDLGRHHAKAVTSIDLENTSGRYLLSGSVDGTILIYDTRHRLDGSHVECPVVARARFGGNQGREQQRAPFHFAGDQQCKHSISAVSWYPHDTGIFISSSTDETLRVWDTNSMIAVEEFELDDIIYHHSMATSTSHFLVAAGDKTGVITLCDIKSGASIHVLRHHKHSVFALAWSPLSDCILASGSKDNTILLWDIRKVGGPLLSLDQHNGAAVSSNSNILTAHNGAVNGLCFTSEGRWLISYGSDHRLRLWDALTGKNMLINYGRVSNWFANHCQFVVTTCGHTPKGGGFLFVPSGHDIIALDLMNGKKLGELQGHFRLVNCCILHPYEQLLFSGGSDCKLLAWSPKKPIIRGPTCTDRSTVQYYDGSSSNANQDAWSDDEG